jgi:hypothetical protein
VSEPGVATFSGAGAGPLRYQYRPVDMVIKDDYLRKLYPETNQTFGISYSEDQIPYLSLTQIPPLLPNRGKHIYVQIPLIHSKCILFLELHAANPLSYKQRARIL